MSARAAQTIAAVAVFIVAHMLLTYGRNGGPVLMAADIQSTPVVFYHESSEEPQVIALLEEFHFDEYVASGRTEFEQMALLKDWVYRHINYDLNYNDSELRNASQILRRSKKGDAFICTNISAVFLQCAVSMGWTSRYIFLKKSSQEEHAGNDVWSNQYRKWVYIDPTWNVHIEKRGAPLSIYEIRREWVKNNGRDIAYVFGAGSNMKRYTVRDLPIRREDSKIWKLIPIDATWLGYSNKIAVLGRNDFFSCCGQNGAPSWDPMYVVRYKKSWKERFRAFFPNGQGYSPKALFYDLNRVDIKIVYEKRKRKAANKKPVEVRLNAFGHNNYTPNFMEYLVKVNGGDWRVMEDRFGLLLDPGPNVIRARIMNRFGVVGPVTEKRILVHAGNFIESPDPADRVAKRLK